MGPAPAVMPGFGQRRVDVGSVRLAYRIGGDLGGPPILLWHGFLGTSWSWRKVAGLLAARGCAVLIPDMRGYGDSDKPAGEQGYDGRALAEELRALVKAIGFGGSRPLTLVAHDMGAPPALLWAADHPDEIAGLAYLEEPVLMPDVLSELIRYTPESTKLGGLWWWMMALAPDMAERLVGGGHERAFLTWNLRSLRRRPVRRSSRRRSTRCSLVRRPGGVAGAFGVYRAVPDNRRADRRHSRPKRRCDRSGARAWRGRQPWRSRP